MQFLVGFFSLPLVWNYNKLKEASSNNKLIRRIIYVHSRLQLSTLKTAQSYNTTQNLT